MTDDPNPNQKKTPENTHPTETTGHEWDGIREYNNPLPRWWVWCFLITVVWGIGYVIYYPAIPLLHGSTPGTSGWNQYDQLDRSLAAAKALHGPLDEKIAALEPEKILSDPSLRTFAIQGGKAAFANNCAQCHTSSGGGGKGYPNLLDDEWMWGGKIEDIVQTIRHGIRSSGDEDTHSSAMTAFGKEGLLTKDQILDVIQHVRVISGNAEPSDASARGQTLFTQNCAACHGESGQGSHEVGAPPLNNDIWLYGGSEDTLYKTIYGGRGGVMPHWAGRLDDVTIKKLAIYVHSLSGGEKSAPHPAP
ncbi:MAG: cytochrome-c oxidase, cbb3-type subunit III [Rhodospirillales bacterium]|nr:cytochrome-c oxidase, cbb3-type subunit III [Rhodospirillales bacterium]